MREPCHSTIEVETSGGEIETLVCAMMVPHESHRATLYWSPTPDEVAAMLAEDGDHA